MHIVHYMMRCDICDSHAQRLCSDAILSEGLRLCIIRKIVDVHVANIISSDFVPADRYMDLSCIQDLLPSNLMIRTTWSLVFSNNDKNGPRPIPT